MTITVKKIISNEQKTTKEVTEINKNYLSLVHQLAVQCSVRIGTINTTIGQLKDLHVGQAIALEQHTNEPVDILLNDKVIARGELMSHEAHFAVHITEVYSQ